MLNRHGMGHYILRDATRGSTTGYEKPSSNKKRIVEIYKIALRHHCLIYIFYPKYPNSYDYHITPQNIRTGGQGFNGLHCQF